MRGFQLFLDGFVPLDRRLQILAGRRQLALQPRALGILRRRLRRRRRAAAPRPPSTMVRGPPARSAEPPRKHQDSRAARPRAPGARAHLEREPARRPAPNRTGAVRSGSPLLCASSIARPSAISKPGRASLRRLRLAATRGMLEIGPGLPAELQHVHLRRSGRRREHSGRAARGRPRAGCAPDSTTAGAARGRIAARGRFSLFAIEQQTPCARQPPCANRCGSACPSTANRSARSPPTVSEGPSMRKPRGFSA